MKTSHKSDELKKKGGSTNRVPMIQMKEMLEDILLQRIICKKKLTVSGDEYINIFFLQYLVTNIFVYFIA